MFPSFLLQAKLADIIKYHVVPGTAYTLDQLTEGMELQTLLAGDKGKLKVHKSATQKKPVLLTTSGQKVPIYQYNLETEGGAQLFTIRGVLVRAAGALLCRLPVANASLAPAHTHEASPAACALPKASPGLKRSPHRLCCLPRPAPQVPGDMPLPAGNTTTNGNMA